MNATLLKSIKPVFFSSRDVALALGISGDSARLACHRYFEKGLLIRPKRDIYVLAENWGRLELAELYALANRLQVPSYISFLTALSYYEITTQIQRNFFESVAVVRTKQVAAVDTIFRYIKIEKKLYFGFTKKDNFFIALPEKAFLDAVYLMSLGRYRLDVSSLDMGKFNAKELKRLAGLFPTATRRLLEKICKR